MACREFGGSARCAALPFRLQMEALRRALAKFGIVELVRTGRISLKRGDRMFDTGSWNPRWVGGLMTRERTQRPPHTCEGGGAAAGGGGAGRGGA